MTFPFPIADDQQNGLTEERMKLVVQQQEQIAQQSDQIIQPKEQAVQQQERIEALEAVVVRLKKLNPKPNIKPNTKPPDDTGSDLGGQPSDNSGDDSGDQPSGDSKGDKPDDSDQGIEKPKVEKPNENMRRKRKPPPKPPVDHEVLVSVSTEDIPPDSIRNGHTPYDVQDLEIKTSTIRYLPEQWITPDGKTITARPPESLHGHHFSPLLQYLILHQCFGCGVTQLPLKELLWDMGITISAGELNTLITCGYERFHSEKDEILATGIRCYHCTQTDGTQTDGTGAGRRGKMASALLSW